MSSKNKKIIEFERPLKPFIIDYTWRSIGKEIIKCPTCGKQGVVRPVDCDNLELGYIVVHKEKPISDLIREFSYVESCVASEEEIRDTLAKKEKERLKTLERKERNRAKHREILA